MLRRSLLLLTIPLFWVSSARAQKEPDFQGHPLHELIADLKAAAPMTRNSAAYSIAGIGPAAAPAVPALIEALHDQEASVRFPALREIGPAASAALPALEEALDDRNDDVAAMAKKAITAIKGG